MFSPPPIMLYNIGIHYSLVGSSMATKSTQFDPTAISDEKATSNKHWALVFTPKYKRQGSVRVELHRTDKGKIELHNKTYHKRLPSHPIATYKGSLADIDFVLKRLPIK